MKFSFFKILALMLTAFLLLSACDRKMKSSRPDMMPKHSKNGSVFGEEGLVLFGGKKEKKNNGPGIEVNSFLWRATLDTISFMPVKSADPFGGVVLTDWYSDVDMPKERFKLDVYIIGRQLRSDALKVSVFKEKYDNKMGWKPMRANKKLARKLEDTILTRARELRIRSADIAD